MLISKSVAIAQEQNQGGITQPGNGAGSQAEALVASGLNQFRSLSIAGDYVAAGTSLRDTTQGNITISGVPAGASVVEAYLYWGMLDNGESPSLKNMNFNGTPIIGTLIGSDQDTCWGRANSFAYRANVTSLVPGNGTYTLTGVASGGFILAQGASLVVIYQRPGDPLRSVILLDGDVALNTGGASYSLPISGFMAAAPVSAKTTFIVGDGQNASEKAMFMAGLGTATFQNPFEGSDGPYWDTDTFNAGPTINFGNTSATARIVITDDCLMWVALAFSVTTLPPFDICLQDDSSGSILQLDSTMGVYLFTNCAGVTVSGTGSLVKRGSVIALQDYRGDLRVLVKVDGAVSKATASIQIIAQDRTFTITDRNTTNNSCSCGN
jgi:hypothetical protein